MQEDKTLLQISETTAATVKLIIEFTRRLPGFHSLCDEDKMIILRRASSESMMIRTARCYDPVSGTILFANNDTFDAEMYDRVGLNTEDLFHFCKKVKHTEHST